MLPVSFSELFDNKSSSKNFSSFSFGESSKLNSLAADSSGLRWLLDSWDLDFCCLWLVDSLTKWAPKTVDLDLNWKFDESSSCSLIISGDEVLGSYNLLEFERSNVGTLMIN